MILDKKDEEIQDKYTKTVKEKVGANAVDWGTAYLNFWYPKELIQQQSNIISANLTDLLFVDPDELEKNEKMIAPNLVNWWPNFRNSETPFIRYKLKIIVKHTIQCSSKSTWLNSSSRWWIWPSSKKNFI
ncbi:hypothetical protein [Mesomycoplasma ovipneumoniae]|uniref:hypothetical protein n=1 Tax=Mesomycoplasma ovipneumoniae TaxID=29562 RepID=UPI00311B0E16